MSFDLHRKLAEQFNGSKQWGYRAVDTLVSLTWDVNRLRLPRTHSATCRRNWSPHSLERITDV